MTESGWRRSSRSGTQGGNCVEVALLAGVTAVRDSKDPLGGRVRVSAQHWQAFLSQVKDGRYDA